MWRTSRSGPDLSHFHHDFATCAMHAPSHIRTERQPETLAGPGGEHRDGQGCAPVVEACIRGVVLYCLNVHIKALEGLLSPAKKGRTVHQWWQQQQTIQRRRKGAGRCKKIVHVNASLQGRILRDGQNIHERPQAYGRRDHGLLSSKPIRGSCMPGQATSPQHPHAGFQHLLMQAYPASW